MLYVEELSELFADGGIVGTHVCLQLPCPDSQGATQSIEIPRFKGLKCPMGTSPLEPFQGFTILQVTFRSREGYPPLSSLSAKMSLQHSSPTAA